MFCMCAKNYENWLRVDEVIGIKMVAFWPILYISYLLNLV